MPAHAPTQRSAAPGARHQDERPCNNRMCTMIVNGVSCSRPSEGALCGPTNDGVSSANGGPGRPTGLHASAWHDPVLFLTRDLGDALEIGVVVQHGEAG